MNTSTAPATAKFTCCFDVDHADHGIDNRMIAWALSQVNTSRFFCDTLTLPKGAPDVDCALYGPTMGDPAVEDEIVQRIPRNGRKTFSRMVEAPKRPSRQLTIIGAPQQDGSIMVYTCYGGPSAPREPGDESMTTDAERQEAADFWATHALARLEDSKTKAEHRRFALKLDNWLLSVT